MADELTLEWEESSGGIDPGDTVTGEVTETHVDTSDHEEYGERTYARFVVESDNGMRFPYDAQFPADNITQNTGLGLLLQRFGAEFEKGETVNVFEFIDEGTVVEFEVARDENNEYLELQKHTLRPPGADFPTLPEWAMEETRLPSMGAASDGGQQMATDDGVTEEVLDLIEEDMEESAAKKLLASESGEHFQAYQSLKDDGRVTVEDGIIDSIDA